MSPTQSAIMVVSAGFPRVSGDEPCASALMFDTPLFSPRERG